MPEYLSSTRAAAAGETGQASADPADRERRTAQVDVFDQKLPTTGAPVRANSLQRRETASILDAAGWSVSVVPA